MRNKGVRDHVRDNIRARMKLLDRSPYNRVLDWEVIMTHISTTTVAGGRR